jgi:hypothetical protein
MWPDVSREHRTMAEVKYNKHTNIDGTANI